MKRTSIFIGALLTLLAVSAPAAAQSVSLRLEPGVAIPTTKPQTERFNPGAAVALKPELGLGSYFSFGPSLQVMQLPSRLNNVDSGNAWSYGGFARLKRPHDDTNTGSGFSAISPWIDADLKLVNTDPLDRFGAAVAVGASVPTSDSRWLWVGPFARYDLVNQEDGKINTNTNSAKTLILGLSLEFGSPRKAEPLPPPPPKDEVVVIVTPTPPPAPKPKDPVVLTYTGSLEEKIQFDWDSAVLKPSEDDALHYVLWGLSTHLKDTIKIEGHASSEGQLEHNNKLAQARADAVLNWLATHGIPRERMSARGFGIDMPIADNKTEAGRKLNRRVEFVVTFTTEKK